MSSFGVSSAPALSTTSRLTSTVARAPACSYSTPTARLSASNSSRCARAPVRMSRFGSVPASLMNETYELRRSSFSYDIHS